MEVKIVMKNYGRGKKRIILVDKSNNMAFVSFGERSKVFDYLKNKSEHKKECQINVFERQKSGCNLECMTGHYCVNFR